MPRNKSKKGGTSSPPAETQFNAAIANPDNMWDCYAILDERGPPQTGEYLIHWKGKDPATGKPWEHSWEVKQSTGQDLIDAWKALKARNPTVVGREGLKLREREAAREKEKRARAKPKAATVSRDATPTKLDSARKKRKRVEEDNETFRVGSVKKRERSGLNWRTASRQSCH